MANNKVRVGTVYVYHANLLDRCDRRTKLEDGDLVKVVNLPGCPKAGVMGQCYVAHPETEEFLGMVHVNSLHTRAEYIAHLKAQIALMEGK